jgi:predicted XRE-type DNA-binding protein
MTANPLQIRLGSGNAYQDLNDRDSNLRQAKALMGARIVDILEDEGLSIRQAEVRTGVSHIEYCRIRQGKLRRFTLDRLLSILDSLGQAVELCVTVHSRAPNAAAAGAMALRCHGPACTNQPRPSAFGADGGG